jgi:hypothetical protein
LVGALLSLLKSFKLYGMLVLVLLWLLFVNDVVVVVFVVPVTWLQMLVTDVIIFVAAAVSFGVCLVMCFRSVCCLVGLHE